MINVGSFKIFIYNIYIYIHTHRYIYYTYPFSRNSKLLPPSILVSFATHFSILKDLYTTKENLKNKMYFLNITFQ